MKYPDVLSKPLSWLKPAAFIRTRGTRVRQVKDKAMHVNDKARPVNDSGMLASNSDILYKTRFRRVLIPRLYRMHTETGYVCCVFCRYLRKSYCHSNCFICSKGVYNKCDTLLPGPSSLTLDPLTTGPSGDENTVTWMFKTPCKYFQRLAKAEYARNLDHGNSLTEITNYETVEGLFCGISNGVKPCQICAVVDLKLFTECPDANGPDAFRDPCRIILERVALSCKINGENL
jgi:hypothetical protein